MQTDPETRAALIAALQWQIELGADEAIGDAPVDRFAPPPPEPDVAPALAHAPPATAAPPPLAETGDADNAAALAEKCETLEALRDALAAFDAGELKAGARNCVFADGLPGARVMIVGEAPGREEDEQGKPFVGRAGKLLDRMLGAIGLDRAADDPAKAAYITNILPWRPIGNRTPSAEEAALFLPFVRRHIALAARFRAADGRLLGQGADGDDRRHHPPARALDAHRARRSGARDLPPRLSPALARHEAPRLGRPARPCAPRSTARPRRSTDLESPMSRIDETREFIPVRFAVLTVSDTRTEADDRSGDTLAQRIEAAGHILAARAILPDERAAIAFRLRDWAEDRDIDAIVTTGGTGLTGRDVTVEAHRDVYEKEIEAFGTLFTMISYEKIGTSAIQSRACAGVANGTYIFALPGSPSACRDGWDAILAPQFDMRHRPCNFVEIMPRLDEHLRRK
jgi:molybdenum cofactor biosynthesis protein B